MKKNIISKSWLIKQKKDPFFIQSKIEGYRSRSAYKLIEMNNKFRFIRNDTYLLDLGAAPGGWSQVAAKKISKGKILAIDIKEMKSLEKVNFMLGDIKDKEFFYKIKNFFDKKIDVVISDIAANTTGHKNLDSYRTGELCLNAMDLANEILNQNGVFLTKIFMGSIFTQVHKKAKKCFKNVIKYKPLSSRSESKEIYIFRKGVLKI